MSSAKENPESFKRRGKDDGFKTSLSNPIFNYKWTHSVWIAIFLLIHVLCLVPQRRRLATLSISAILFLGVCEIWFLRQAHKVSHNGRPAHICSPVMTGVGRGEPGT